jgi:simple sugar transport system ATP-binding protein
MGRKQRRVQPQIEDAVYDPGISRVVASADLFCRNKGVGMAEYLLKARALEKSFGHVNVLRGVDFDVKEKEVTALVGDNGAGKSTTVKILSGSLRADSGTIEVRGDKVDFSSPEQAMRAGFETVYQDLALAPDLPAFANMYLGREIKRHGVLGGLGFLDRKQMRLETEESFRRLGTTVKDVTTPVSSLSGGQRQAVAVARAAAWAKTLIFMDEPTAALGVVQTEHVLKLIESVRNDGKSVVLISHNLPDVFRVADRIQVLRLGKRVANIATADATMTDIVAAMTGAKDFEAEVR